MGKQEDKRCNEQLEETASGDTSLFSKHGGKFIGKSLTQLQTLLLSPGTHLRKY